MEKNLLYMDPFVEVWVDRVNVIHDSHTDPYDIKEILSSEPLGGAQQVAGTCSGSKFYSYDCFTCCFVSLLG